jgi:hypothetical protein
VCPAHFALRAWFFLWQLEDTMGFLEDRRKLPQ